MKAALINPVRLGFDPEKLKETAQELSEHTGCWSIRQIFANDVARTFWLAIKGRFLTCQHFRDDCMKVAMWIERGELTGSDEAALHARLYTLLSLTKMFEMGRGLDHELVDELLPYLLLRQKLEYEVGTT
jgi:hypothetical protein